MSSLWRVAVVAVFFIVVSGGLTRRQQPTHHLIFADELIFPFTECVPLGGRKIAEFRKGGELDRKVISALILRRRFSILILRENPQINGNDQASMVY